MNLRQQREQKFRNQILIITSMILLATCCWLSSEIKKEIQTFNEAKQEYDCIKTILEDVELDLEQVRHSANGSFEDLNEQSQIYSEQLDVASEKLSEVQELSNEFETTSSNEMRGVYEKAEENFDEAMDLLDDIDIDSIESGKNEINSYVSCLCNEAQLQLEIANFKLRTCTRYKTLNFEFLSTKYLALHTELENIYKSVQRKSSNIISKINTLQFQNTSAYQISKPLSNSIAELKQAVEEYETLEITKAGLKEKLEALEISESLDMSIPIGFTEEELVYLLEESEKISNQAICTALPSIMVESMKEYPVNELFSLSVMSLESGFFTTYLAKKQKQLWRVAWFRWQRFIFF